jgi:hypothetical protein
VGGAARGLGNARRRRKSGFDQGIPESGLRMPRRTERGETNNVTGLVHIDAALTNISIAYKNAQNIIRQVLLPFPSTKKSDVVWKYGQELFLSEDDTRAAGAEAKDTTWALSTVNFQCGGHALRDRIPRDTENNADPALNLIADSTTVLTAKAQLNEEINGVAALVAAMTGASVSNIYASPWNSNTYNPYTVLRAAIDTITLACGTAPNCLALSAPVWTAIRTNTNVTGLITGAPQLPNVKITLAQFAELLELDEVVVGRTVYNTVPGATKTFVWGQKALLFYRAPNPGLRQLALGYTPLWTNALASVTGLKSIPGMDGQGDTFVQQYYWEPEICDYVVVHRYYDQEIWAPECGILYTGCLGTSGA